MEQMHNDSRCIMRIAMVRQAKIHIYVHCASAQHLGLYKAEATVVLIKKCTKNH